MGEGFPTKFLIDGIDRLGKSSLIERIQQDLGYHLVIHYDKPKLLANIEIGAEFIRTMDPSQVPEYDESYRSMSTKNLSLRMYQEEANEGMFELLTTKTPIIFDRTHLGECVYAPLYRKYSGDYVFEMEKELIARKPFSIESDVRLILLTTSCFDMIEDDGLSFDFNKKEEEQEMFIQAFNKSNLPNKVIVDVHNGSKGYKTYEEVFTEAIYKSAKK